MHLFIRSFIRSFIRLAVYSFIHWIFQHSSILIFPYAIHIFHFIVDGLMNIEPLRDVKLFFPLLAYSLLYIRDEPE